VDGCPKRFARKDKQIEHLRKGHKLGDGAIEALFAANLREE
jgi:hypothetical protein